MQPFSGPTSLSVFILFGKFVFAVGDPQRVHPIESRLQSWQKCRPAVNDRPGSGVDDGGDGPMTLVLQTCFRRLARAARLALHQEDGKPGTDLPSRSVARPVLSALGGLTSVFGMGTGVSPPLWAPDLPSCGLPFHQDFSAGSPIGQESERIARDKRPSANWALRKGISPPASRIFLINSGIGLA